MIRANNIDFDIGAKRILSKINLVLKPSEINVVLGKNGAGKSTLLNVLSGELQPRSGQVVLDDISMQQYSPKDLADRRAVLSQSTQLAYSLKVIDVVEMGCYNRYNSMSSDQRSQLINKALDKLQLNAFFNRDFLSLSGGERQRVLLAKCLVQLYAGKQQGKKQYLLLDEPTAALDVEQQYLLLEMATSLARQEGIGILAILHNLNLAARFADQILLLQNGELICSGNPWEVLTTQTLQRTFSVDCIVQKHPHFNAPLITTYGKYSGTPKSLRVA